MTSRDPVPISSSLDDVVRSLRGPSRESVGGLFGRWDEAVGDQVAHHVKPLKLDEGVLVVEVDDPAWATQVKFLTPMITERSATRGQRVRVDRIDVRVKRAAPAALGPDVCRIEGFVSRPALRWWLLPASLMAVVSHDTSGGPTSADTIRATAATPILIFLAFFFLTARTSAARCCAWARLRLGGHQVCHRMAGSPSSGRRPDSVSTPRVVARRGRGCRPRAASGADGWSGPVEVGAGMAATGSLAGA